MSAAIVPTRRTLVCRAWARLRCAYWRFRIASARSDIKGWKADIDHAHRTMLAEFDFAEFEYDRLGQIALAHVYIDHLQRRIRMAECA